MLTNLNLGDKIIDWLVEIDEQTCRRVAAQGCPVCGGPLHRGDYPRKPRGGLLAAAGEKCTRRFSLCCGRQGCRRRATPPSVRFLGRRVYLGVALVLASVLACLASAPAVARTTGIPSRTISRWDRWWKADFPHSRLFQEQQGRLLPPLEIGALPACMWQRLEGAGRPEEEVGVRMMCWLSPLTSGSSRAEARFVRDRRPPAEHGSCRG